MQLWHLQFSDSENIKWASVHRSLDLVADIFLFSTEKHCLY